MACWIAPSIGWSFIQLQQKGVGTVTSVILNSQEMQNDSNLKMLNLYHKFYQLLGEFRKFQNVTIQRIATFVLHNTYHDHFCGYIGFAALLTSCLAPCLFLDTC